MREQRRSPARSAGREMLRKLIDTKKARQDVTRSMAQLRAARFALCRALEVRLGGQVRAASLPDGPRVPKPSQRANEQARIQVCFRCLRLLPASSPWLSPQSYVPAQRHRATASAGASARPSGSSVDHVTTPHASAAFRLDNDEFCSLPSPPLDETILRTSLRFSRCTSRDARCTRDGGLAGWAHAASARCRLHLSSSHSVLGGVLGGQPLDEELDDA